MTQLCICVCVFVTLVLQNSDAADRGTQCITPNQEAALCTPVTSCHIIRDAITTQNKSAIDFAKKSQCGYDTEPLVCCGTSAYSSEPSYFGFFTKSPPTSPPKRILPSLSSVSSNSLPDRSICGIERETQRLIGATTAGIDEFPWMGLIRYNNERGVDVGFKCGATLINNRYLLTAAHCILTSPEPITVVSVRLGEWKLSTQMDCIYNIAISTCSDPVVDVNIDQQIPHPYFSSSNGNNDIGLLRLETNVNYTDSIRPICLPPPELPTPKDGTFMDISGWGITETGRQSDYKLKAQVPVLSNEECKKVFTDYSHINPNQACAGGKDGKDACHGDSGGPLMTTFKKKDVLDEDQWYQEGIIYRGIGCGRKGVPSLYTRISRYSRWILNTIHSNV
ncbi:hypothetical protein RI129_000821 [Pyrocoelia pectoralis]|uniref:CLIP domain-containing serine protease n=1 Tax=Pyrocoelia pectoralis TaxID=417401 RepID=A0AAN7ZP85_9COLE